MATVVGSVPLPTKATPPPVSRLAGMEHSRVALPEPEYLASIGEIAYTVSSMRWTLLGDLHPLAADLPAPLTINELEPLTTGAIGACACTAAANGMTPGPVRPAAGGIVVRRCTARAPGN